MKPATLGHYGLLLACLAGSTASQAANTGHCPGYQSGQRNLYWGDLHVHTAYSMDAYAFGTTANPADAFAFARGAPITLADGKTRQQLRRPLDFAAVTDHAETFDVMQLCTAGPEQLDNPYCRGLRAGAGTDLSQSRNIFVNYLLPVIAGGEPALPALCEEEGIDCDSARSALWQQSQRFANDADSPCEFTAFVANEWSATPGSAHWHRNLIYRSAATTPTAIDYVRYPTPLKLWQALDEQCRAQDGCDVVAIPHNTNFAEGGGFDVEAEQPDTLRLRARFERLVEIHQSKGNSECIAENWDNADSDCGFEKAFHSAASKERAATDPAYVKTLNRAYVRNILSRGLQAYIASDKAALNPLQLGFVGSTDAHAATAGATEEDAYTGDAWGGGGSDPRRIQGRPDYNPGGLVGIWAAENTRASLFDALKRRETYATSGTRIALRFSADRADAPDACSADYDYSNATAMGATLGSSATDTPVAAPRLTVLANMDRTPLQRVEIIKGTLDGNGDIVQQVITLADLKPGSPSTCNSWTDPDFDPARPAYWYARVKELPTERWSKRLCESLDNCNDVPGADRLIQETAWSSPIWYLP
ncbi:DUF3604 domain-containing protein [Parahaliea mediterranea]|uniref:DUF3604 domain-containing protein n=1 Tax=Parahaliea mediterranea TaxID=651086 RepID=UPI000E2EBDED|nr:DUF3604 domain-containing protein [Parahaliea mediterranea]